MEEEYINIEDLINNKEKLYQIQIQETNENEEQIIIKNVGYGSEVPEMIILEDFGKEKNLSIYNCILSERELQELNELANKDYFYPVIQLIEKDSINNRNEQYFIGIKLLESIKYDEKISSYEKYFIYNNYENKDLLNYKKITTNINSSNIIEIIIDEYCKVK